MITQSVKPFVEILSFIFQFSILYLPEDIFPYLKEGNLLKNQRLEKKSKRTDDRKAYKFTALNDKIQLENYYKSYYMSITSEKK